MSKIYLDDAMKELNIDTTETDIIKQGSESDYTQIKKEDGTLRLRGSSTAWTDMISDLIGRRLNSASGKVNYDWSNNAIKFQSGGLITNENDRVQGNQEINHNYKVGSGISFGLHLHWFQEVTSHIPDILDTNPYIFTIEWRHIKNGHGLNLSDPWNVSTVTSNLTNNIFDATFANGKDYIGQITAIPDIEIDCDISDTIQWRMARTDSELGDVLVYFFDIHGENDSFGSETKFAKEV